jgi:hypothetical protein
MKMASGYRSSFLAPAQAWTDNLVGDGWLVGSVVLDTVTALKAQIVAVDIGDSSRCTIQSSKKMKMFGCVAGLQW